MRQTQAPTSTGRIVRLSAVALVLVLLLIGTFWGDDDMFPVGPFRMYSVTNELDGTVATVTFDAITADGERVELGAEAFGLRRAEVEGHLARLVDHPSSLQGLVAAYERLHEDGASIAELRLVEEASRLEDGRPVSTERRVLASWEAP